jgi:hypothetical protein
MNGIMLATLAEFFSTAVSWPIRISVQSSYTTRAILIF